jgi:hypothetical protein
MPSSSVPKASKLQALVPVRVSLLVMLLIVNAAGILLLFLKSELDVQQVRNEIGLVWREGQVGYVTQSQCSQDVEDIREAHEAQRSSEEFYAAHTWGVYTHNYTAKPIIIDEGIRRSLGRVLTDTVNLACDAAQDANCDASTNTMPVAIDLYSVASWSAPGDHVFYLRVAGEGGPKWYGPFVDDINRLKAEAEQ